MTMKRIVEIAWGALIACQAVWAQQYLIATVAGGGSVPFSPVAALKAALPPPASVAADALGNVYFTAGDVTSTVAESFLFKLDRSGIVTRLAGGGTRDCVYSGVPATSVKLCGAIGVAVDSGGNVYFADSFGYTVRRVGLDGTITTVAGDGVPEFFGDGGPATSAGLCPTGVAVDLAGNVYIVDNNPHCNPGLATRRGGSHVIRKVAPDGTITTVAGDFNLPGVSSGDGGPATQAGMDPSGVAVDAAGNLYISDADNCQVRKVDANGIISTVAGNGTCGYSGDGGPATRAQIGALGVAVDRAGNLYIDDAQRIRKVAPDGTIATVAGNGTAGNSGDGGPAISAQIAAAGVAADGAGNVYIPNAFNGVNLIRKAGTDGTIRTVAGGGAGTTRPGDGGLATSAQLAPRAVAVDAAGNLYIGDDFHLAAAVRKVTANGIITTFAGSGTGGYSGDGGPATSASLSYVTGLVVDAAGNLDIADAYFDTSVVRKVAANGTITTLAGNGLAGFSGDGGPATSAELNWPGGLALDAAGDVYIADSSNYRVREVAPDGTIATVAGNGARGFSGDGGPATSARLDPSGGLAVDSAGNLYIADQDNHSIRRVAADGTITTVAGNGTPDSPVGALGGLAVDAAGNLYWADSFYSAILRMTPDGTITAVAGNGTQGYSGDGGPATSAELDYPTGVALDAAGNVYFADTGNSVVRLLVPAGARALLSVTESASGEIGAGQTGAMYSVVVSNAAGAGPTSGMVTVTQILSPSLTVVSMSGAGWTCTDDSCARSDVLAPGSSYPAIAVTVNVAGDAPPQAVSQAIVSGGGSTVASTVGITVIALPAAPVLMSPANGAVGIPSPALSWSDSVGATSYDVYFGTSSVPPLVANTLARSYAPGALLSNATYYWQIVAQTPSGPAGSATWSFTTGAGPSAALRFVAVTPCRVADTRLAAGPFGGPTLAADSTRSFAIPEGSCGIPSTAQAYSLNVTVVPEGPLGYLTVWPAGQAKPWVSTLNSWEGDVAANAVIVPAGAGGAVDVYVTDPTDVILDINGYFDASDGAWFYDSTPCRVVDTRRGADLFGGPSIPGGQSRDFPVPSGSCGLPSGAAAYAMNVTAVPSGALGFLTAWPTGQERPFVSTLNSWTGKVVANAAIVPAGSNGSVSVFVTDPADVILDANGYFASAGNPGALSFYSMTPCRIADTRNPEGLFGGPVLEAGSTRSFAIPASACYVPATAAAYSLNVTVVPGEPLPYLTAWPAGAAQPFVSTLNSGDGTVVANAAIIPAGVNGAISVFVTGRTHVILDINGYFAP